MEGRIYKKGLVFVVYGFADPKSIQFLLLHQQQTTNDKHQTTNNKQQTTNDKHQTTNDKHQTFPP